MLRNDYEGQICALARSLELIGERWTLMVIREVFLGRRRFSEMQENLGIARNVLTSRLQRLVDAGILEKRPYSERPHREQYYLTEMGLDLWPTIVTLTYWGDTYVPLPGGAPMILRHKGDCGGVIDDRRICEKCGMKLTVRESVATEGPGLKPALRELERASRAERTAA